jgi:hypothetical protein
MKKHMNIAVFSLLLFPFSALAVSGGELASLPENLSATALCRQMGMEEAELLVIGGIDDVRNGTINLASTIPPTVGKISLPGNTPTSYPPQRRKREAFDDFDVRLFCAISKLTPALGDDDVYNNLIKRADGTDPRFAPPMRIKPVCLDTVDAVADLKLKGKNQKVSNNKRDSAVTAKKSGNRERRQSNSNAVNKDSNVAPKMYKSSGRTRDYF